MVANLRAVVKTISPLLLGWVYARGAKTGFLGSAHLMVAGLMFLAQPIIASVPEGIWKEKK